MPSLKWKFIFTALGISIFSVVSFVEGSGECQQPCDHTPYFLKQGLNKLTFLFADKITDLQSSRHMQQEQMKQVTSNLENATSDISKIWDEIKNIRQDMADIKSLIMSLSHNATTTPGFSTTVVPENIGIGSHFPNVTTPGYIEGRLQNLNESSPSNQDRGCGGIVVGSSGRISFQQDWHTNESYKCVWTVRPLNKAWLEFRLHSDELGKGNIISLTNLGYAYSSVSTLNTSATIFIKSGDRQFHRFNNGIGDILMLVVNSVSNTPVQFQMDYNEYGPNNTFYTSFYNYHYRKTGGYVNYPLKTYESKSIYTFVINPLISTNNSLNILLRYLFSDESMDCASPTFLYFLRSTRNKMHMERIGPSNTNNRFCGRIDDLKKTTLQGENVTDVWIAVFWTYNSKPYFGFDFDWSI